MLRLQGCDCGNAGAAFLASSASSLQRLAELDVSDNGLGGEGLSVLLASLQFAPLAKLDASGNYLCSNAGGAAALAAALAYVPSLLELRIDHAGLGDVGAAAIASALAGLAPLTSLRLEHNSISHVGMTSLAQALSRTPLLEKLMLHSNRLGALGASALAFALSDVPQLTMLDLASSSIGPVGMASLASSLGCLKLQLLNVDSRGIGDEGAACLGLALRSRLPQLTTLAVSANNLSAPAAAQLRAAASAVAHVSA